MADNNSQEKASPIKRENDVSLSEQFVQFMGDNKKDENVIADPMHPFEIFSLYDHSKYEIHTYSNVQQIPTVL